MANYKLTDINEGKELGIFPPSLKKEYCSIIEKYIKDMPDFKGNFQLVEEQFIFPGLGLHETLYANGSYMCLDGTIKNFVIKAEAITEE